MKIKVTPQELAEAVGLYLQKLGMLRGHSHSNVRFAFTTKNGKVELSYAEVEPYTPNQPKGGEGL